MNIFSLKPFHLGSLFGLLLLLFLSSGPTAARVIPEGKLPKGVTPLSYQIDLDVSPEAKRFSGKVRILVKLDQPEHTIWLHSRDLIITSAKIISQTGTELDASFEQVSKSGVAVMTVEKTVGPGLVTLDFQFKGEFGQPKDGLYTAQIGDQMYAYTHFQTHKARRMFPGFDEPRFKTPFDISVTIEQSDTAVSNAPEKQVTTTEDGRKRVTFATTKPLPTYLLALAVGEFDVVIWPDLPPNNVRDHPVPLRAIAPKGKSEQMTLALQHTEELLTLLGSGLID